MREAGEYCITRSFITCSSQRRMRCTGHVAWERGGILTEVWIGKPEGKRPLGRSRHRWRIISKWVMKK
jgi:hypothetical protein